MSNKKACDNNNGCCSRPINRTIYQTIVGATGPTGATGPKGETGPTGATGPTGTTALLEASINRNDSVQTVLENNVVSITGTNVLTNIDGDMIFVNNTVRLGMAGVYLVNATIETTGATGVYEFSIDVGGTNYNFVANINDGSNKGTVSHTIFLNIATDSTAIAIYSRHSGSVTISKAELDVVKLM